MDTEEINEKLDKLFSCVTRVLEKLDNVQNKLDKHIAQTEVEISSIKDDLKQKEAKLHDIEQSQVLINSLFESSKKDVKDVKGLVKENQVLQNKIVSLDKALAAECKTRNKLEQYGRNSMLEFGGIPVADKEDCISIVCSISKIMGIRCTPDDVDIAHRLKKNSIIAVFSRRSVRDSVFFAKKSLKGHTVKELHLPVPLDQDGKELPGYIFINESLTPTNKNLLFEAKKGVQEIKHSIKMYLHSERTDQSKGRTSYQSNSYK